MRRDPSESVDSIKPEQAPGFAVDETLTATAYHEAGHAVMALSLG